MNTEGDMVAHTEAGDTGAVHMHMVEAGDTEAVHMHMAVEHTHTAADIDLSMAPHLALIEASPCKGLFDYSDIFSLRICISTKSV